MELVAGLFAGLGLFFIGLNNLTRGMRTLASRNLHQLLQHATTRPLKTALIGIVSGAATQSTTALTFITVSMVMSGAIGLLQGLLITIWSNIGATLLVFLATVDLHLFLEMFIGLLGIAYYFGLDKTESSSQLLSLLVGLALLMFGLFLIKESAASLQESTQWLDRTSLRQMGLLLLFVMGILVTLVTQSAASVSAVIITLLGSSLLSLEQAVAIILGANIGAGISVWLIGRHLTGSGKKLVLCQMLTKVLGVSLTLPWLIFPALLGFLQQHFGIPVTVVLLILYIQFIGALCISLFASPLLKTLGRLIVEDASEELRKPKYLTPLALEDAESALDLLEKEQYRIISKLPDLVKQTSPHSPAAQALSDSLVALTHACNQFCMELINRTHQQNTLERALKAQKRNELLLELCRNLDQLLLHLEHHQINPTSRQLKNTLIESLHFVLLCFDDAKRDTGEIETLLMLTSDRSTLMEQTREALVISRTRVDEKSLSHMLSATARFERLIWLIHNYANGLSHEINPIKT